MILELPKQARADAVASLRRYCEANLPEPLGELPAAQLLDFFLEEIAPAVYNQAVREAQARLQQRVADLDGELYRDEMQFWARRQRRRGTAAEAAR